MTKQSFGGSWTTKKLECLYKYFPAYTTIMSKQNFKDYMYIDAFAGTGWFVMKKDEAIKEEQGVQLSLFPEKVDIVYPNSHDFLDGSARIALKTNPPFTKYIFIEKNKKRFEELKKLQKDFPDKQIIFENHDANNYLNYLCNSINWLKNNKRAVLFLDPFGMNVSWQTIELIANTKAIDLWYLFPMGVALNRLLTKDGKISDRSQEIISNMLGTNEWYNIFYEQSKNLSLFNNKVINKTATFDSIAQYVNERLSSVFSGVAKNPKMLFNKKRNPLYLLCFTSANPKGSTTAIKIAQDILRRD